VDTNQERTGRIHTRRVQGRYKPGENREDTNQERKGRI